MAQTQFVTVQTFAQAAGRDPLPGDWMYLAVAGTGEMRECAQAVDANRAAVGGSVEVYTWADGEWEFMDDYPVEAEWR